MAKKIVIALAVLLVAFLGYVSTRESKFRYERSGLINAPAEKIYPYLSQLKLGAEWSPYEKKDPDMKRGFQGTDGTVGAIETFDGNKDVGAGQLEILKLVPNELVELKLTMTKPFRGENIVEYRLTPEGGGTRFTWAMHGDGGFLTKLVSVFMDCEKMVSEDFERGIANLRALAEKGA